MALPTASEVLSLDYIGWSLPQASVDAKTAVNSFTLDIVGWSLPQICQPTGSSAPADPTNIVYIKTGASTWSEASAIYLKTAASTWSVLNEFSIKTSSGWNGVGDNLYSGVTWSGSSPVALTAAEHYYDQGTSQEGNPVDINVSDDSSADETWSDIAVASTSGKRLFVIIMSFRFANASASQWANRFQNNAAGLTLELSASGTTTALTYRGAYAASEYNSTSIWTAMVDGATTSTHDYEIELDDATAGALHGNFAYSAIVLDEVNTVEYLNIESLGFSGTSNQTVTSALNLAPNNTTSATKVLRIAASNGSNITANDLDYNKGGSEPTYTQIGEGDNGTDERHYHAYHFGDHGTQVNMTGTFGNGSTTASNGMSGLGCIIGLS